MPGGRADVDALVLAVGIIGGILGVLGAFAAAAVYWGGSWRKSEMEMLRNSREDLTARVTELESQRDRDKIALEQRDERITHLTDLVTSRQAYDQLVRQFEGIVTSLATHWQRVDQQHGAILSLITRVAERIQISAGEP